ncbi:MAG: hypothetical protein FWF49_00590, partial [Oscillospiraceae bacterium]|nr:hypothetical protein [Oscillospiraceae bacterium]
GSGSRCAFFAQPQWRLRKNDRQKGASKWLSSSAPKKDGFVWLLKKESENRAALNLRCLFEAFFHRHVCDCEKKAERDPLSAGHVPAES